MSAAREAYRFAQGMITEATVNRSDSLSFDRPETRALERLPPEIRWLDGLRNLCLDDTKITDISPVRELIGLTTLALGSTQVKDLSPLAKLTKITMLLFPDMPIRDLSPLARLTGITKLLLSDTLVSDLSPIAGLTGIIELGLSNTRIDDISPLVGLTGITMLMLDNTRVSDLTPIAGLTGITGLTLGNSPVVDLRPLCNLRKLADQPSVLGLHFRDTGATSIDPRIDGISRIENPAKRARALFDYLDGWKMPVDPTAVPMVPDPLLHAVLSGGRLEIEPDPPIEAEQRDRLKQALHERLRMLLLVLAQTAGNHFPRLASRARALIDQIEKPFEELDLLSLHLEIEDLEDRRQKGTEEGVPLSDEVIAALRSVTNIGPGLTLDHPSVEILLDRRRRARDEKVVAKDETAREALSNAILADADANGPRSREMEALLERIADKAVSGVLRKAKHKNLIILLGTVAATATSQVGYNLAANLIADAYGANITSFVTTNWSVLMDVAATYGQGATVWFQSTVGPLVGGIDTTAIRPVDRYLRR